MQSGRILKSAALLAILSIASAQAVEFKSADQSVSTRYGSPAPTASEKSASTAPAETPALGDDATEEEQREAIRQELEQRDAARDEQRRLSCEKARSEIQRVGELPARRVQRVDESGQRTRMTEDDQKAHLDKMRTIEAENCQ